MGENCLLSTVFSCDFAVIEVHGPLDKLELHKFDIIREGIAWNFNEVHS